MAKTYTEAKFSNGKHILRVDAPFDEALIALQDKEVKHPTSTYELVDARIQFSKSHSLNDNGSYNKEGFLYAKSQLGLIALNSPLLDVKLARAAAQFNREGNYYSTKDNSLYDYCREIAEKDKNKAPEEREVLELPSRKSFPISPKKNEDIFRALFRNKGEKYLNFIGLNEITVYPVDSTNIDIQNGTLITQLWLHRLGDDSVVYGDDRNLIYSVGVRWVLPISGEASTARKILEYPAWRSKF